MLFYSSEHFVYEHQDIGLEWASERVCARAKVLLPHQCENKWMSVKFSEWMGERIKHVLFSLSLFLDFFSYMTTYIRTFIHIYNFIFSFMHLRHAHIKVVSSVCCGEPTDINIEGIQLPTSTSNKIYSKSHANEKIRNTRIRRERER